MTCELNGASRGIRQGVRNLCKGGRRRSALGVDSRHSAIIASALIAAIGQAESFAKGHDLAAWLGLVPKQSTTGGKPRLSRISKRGNKYLRKLLIHGARSALPSIVERDTPLGRWAKGLLGRAHKNIAVVALANKLARIAWAVLRRHEKFAIRDVLVAA
jgi:transposase